MMDIKTEGLILVVDDQPNLREYVQQALNLAGYQVLTARNGVEALDILESQPVNLILADIAMPRMNGYQLHERVMANPQWVIIPFVFLTARSQDSDIRYAKELGVDDYLTKPFNREDLLAVVRGKLRRARRVAQLSSMNSLPQPTLNSSVLSVGRLRIDRDQIRVLLNDKSIKLSAREFRLLECLALQAENVVSLSELIQTTHRIETDDVEAGGLLRPLIRSLRRKLGYRAGDMGCIQNVRGVGYRLIPPGNSQ
ncbi:MAG: response regulator transcription factor [Chloroflexi bacterium]|nr:response regulator transcription factor [Chloroflexota bacterium]